MSSSLIINGRAVADKILADCRTRAAKLTAERCRPPGLAVVLVGENPASRAYVRSKDKTCRELGFHSVKEELPAGISQLDLLSLIARLNADPEVDGILVQSPLPTPLD